MTKKTKVVAFVAVLALAAYYLSRRKVSVEIGEITVVDWNPDV